MTDPQELDEVDVLTRTVYGEARGENAEGQIAVVWVIRNRVAKGRAHMGKTIKEVCLKPQQFSCWNSNDPNRNALLKLDENNGTYRQIRRLVDGVLNGNIVDNTQGSTHYHTKQVSPAWAKNKSPAVIIGAHLFYNNVD